MAGYKRNIQNTTLPYMKNTIFLTANKTLKKKRETSGNNPKKCEEPTCGKVQNSVEEYLS